MTENRTKELLEDYKQALVRLNEALSEDLSKGSIVIDGTIQRFEFTLESEWKLIKAVLQYQGIEAATPRSAIKEGFRVGIIKDGDGWIDILEDRNKTSHIYDEKEAKVIYNKIKDLHIKLLKDLEQSIKLE